MIAEILAFRPRVARVEPLPAPSTPPEHYRCIRERGVWRDGLWWPSDSEACAHRHRSADAAARCLSERWADGRREWVWCDGVGQILGVLPDGSTVLVEHRKPPRFQEVVETAGRVTVTWRLWHFKDEWPGPNRPVEVTLSCGAFECTFRCTRAVNPSEAEGMGWALHLLMADRSAEEVVAVWHRMQASPIEEFPDGVVRLRP